MPEGFRLRVCFRKAGRLRYLSHLETGRAWERAARRAGLPYAVTQGYTPRMKVAFGPALPVGTAGMREYLDITTTRFVAVAQVRDALAASIVEDLAPVECAYVSPSEPSLASRLTIAEYEVECERGVPPQELERSLDAIMRTGGLETEHKGKQKFFDLAVALPKEPEVVSDAGRAVVRMWVRMGPHGSLRPETFMNAAIGPGRPVAVTRTELFIEDERGWSRPL